MKLFTRPFKGTLLTLALGWASFVSADNQTPTITPIIPNDKDLPFTIRIEQDCSFSLPSGFHSGVLGEHDNKWLFLAGRINGMHTFSNEFPNFPSQLQNRSVIVVDPHCRSTVYRSLDDPKSGLTQEQIDQLSVTAPQGYQKGTTLYMTGGYGIDSATGKFTTKNALTAIDVPGLIHWATHPNSDDIAAQHIRQVFDETFKVTGGYMSQIEGYPTLLIFGQDFEGQYFHKKDPVDPPKQFYTEQVRRFDIIDDGVNLSFILRNPLPAERNPHFRRRDLNIVPVLKFVEDQLEESFVAFSGVFTKTTGIWTVPVEIAADGTPFMAKPKREKTFKQGMNNYNCAVLGMFSEETGEMFNVLLGGISFGFFENGEFKTGDLPFINQTTTIKTDKRGTYTQYWMKEGGFPSIKSTQVNPGNRLLFGTNADFIPKSSVSKYSNGVLRFDEITKPRVVGYIVGGIQSTLTDINTLTDSSASTIIFKVIVSPKEG